MKPLISAISFALVAALLAQAAYADDDCPHRMLFDKFAVVKYNVTVGNDTLRICEYKNIFGFLGGLEVYDSNGVVVADPGSALQQAVWDTYSRSVTQADIALLENVSDAAASISAAVQAPYRMTSSAVATLDGLKNFQLMGQSAWGAAVGAVPQLAAFDGALAELNDELYSWFSYSRGVVASNRELASLLNANASYEQLSPALQSAVAGMNSLASNVDDLDATIGTVLSRISPVRSDLDRAASTPLIGPVIGDLAGTVRSVETAVSGFQGQLRSMSYDMKSQSNRFSLLSASVERDASALHSQWQQRQRAAANLNIMLAAAAVVAALPLLFLALRRIRTASHRAISKMERVLGASMAAAAVLIVAYNIGIAGMPYYAYALVTVAGLIAAGAWHGGALQLPLKFLAWSFASAFALLLSYGVSMVFYVPLRESGVLILYAAGIVAVSQLLRVFIRQWEWSYKTLAGIWHEGYENAVKTAAVASAAVFFAAAFLWILNVSALLMDFAVMVFFEEHLPAFYPARLGILHAIAALLAIYFEFGAAARKIRSPKPAQRQGEHAEKTLRKLEEATRNLKAMKARGEVDEKSYRTLGMEYAERAKEARQRIKDETGQRSREKAALESDSAKIRKMLKELEVRNGIGELSTREFRAKRMGLVKKLNDTERKRKLLDKQTLFCKK